MGQVPTQASQAMHSPLRRLVSSSFRHTGHCCLQALQPGMQPSLCRCSRANGSTGSSSTVQQMEEREKPDPADKKAMEEYNFWMQVKSKIRATAEGKTLRITVKEGIEYMPASVMQTLYECKVGITLYWDGVTIEIPVGKAQPKQALRVYWTKTKLMDLYNA